MNYSLITSVLKG